MKKLAKSRALFQYFWTEEMGKKCLYFLVLRRNKELIYRILEQ